MWYLSKDSVKDISLADVKRGFSSIENGVITCINVYMEHTYSPKQFGKLIGKSVNTLQKWDRQGILHAYRSPTNRRYYTHAQYLRYRGLISSEQGKVIAYARVSSPSQKKDLATQREALRAYCQDHHIRVDQWVEDIGSALNYKRKGFNEVVEQIELGQVSRLIIAYQD